MTKGKDDNAGDTVGSALIIGTLVSALFAAVKVLATLTAEEEDILMSLTGANAFDILNLLAAESPISSELAERFTFISGVVS